MLGDEASANGAKRPCFEDHRAGAAEGQLAARPNHKLQFVRLGPHEATLPRGAPRNERGSVEIIIQSGRANRKRTKESF